MEEEQMVDKRKAARPTVTHTDTAKQKQRLASLTKYFLDLMKTRCEKAAFSEGLEWDNPKGKNLLRLRKQLVATTKQGMLEREDMEIEIAMLAMFVWFNRMNFEQQLAIMTRL